MLALDVSRVEAGLLLIDVDFNSSRKALIESQKYSPFEMGLGRLVNLDKGPFVGRTALVEEARGGPVRMVVGLQIDWTEVEALYDRFGLAPVAPAAASRVAVPVMHQGQQVGRATTTAWSPTLKRLIALATVDAPFFADRHTPAGRDDRRSDSSLRERRRHQDAVLQSAAQDGRAAGLTNSQLPNSQLPMRTTRSSRITIP